MAETRRKGPSWADRRAAKKRGQKWCSGCGCYRKAEFFTKQTATTTGLSTYCSKCKVRQNRHSREERAGQVDQTLRERWFAKVRMNPEGCWEWLGARDPYGHGKILVNGASDGFAHRIGYTLFTGYVFAKRERLRNLCGDPGCPRWDHWELMVAKYKPAFKDAKAKAIRRARDRKLVARVESALPSGLPPDVTEELRQELALAMMSGRSDARRRITASKLKRATKNAWRSVLPESPYSVDAPIGADEDDMTFRDILEDASIYSDPLALVDISRRLGASLDVE